MVAALRGTPRDTGLDLEYILKVGEQVEIVVKKYREFMDNSKMSVIDTGVLVHQIPGGMISNLVIQLKQAKVLDRIDEVFKELPRVRAEMGYFPLVTPTSQIIGAQAVQNVLAGRYKVVSTQFMDYCLGMYGKPPAMIDPDIQKQVLKYHRKGHEPISCRPADTLEPEMDAAWEKVRHFSKDTGDALTAAIIPITGMKFLKQKYGGDTQLDTKIGLG